MKVTIDLSELNPATRKDIAIQTTDKQLLLALAKDEDSLVRLAVVSNSNVPKEVLSEHANEDEDSVVSWRAKHFLNLRTKQ